MFCTHMVDFHRPGHIWFMRLRKMQRWAARWALSDYNCYSSLTKISWMADTGKWKEYLFSRLSQLYKIMRHHISAIHLLPYYLRCTNTISNKTPPPESLYITIYLYPLLPTSKAFSQGSSINRGAYRMTSWSLTIKHFVAAITIKQVL